MTYIHQGLLILGVAYPQGGGGVGATWEFPPPPASTPRGRYGKISKRNQRKTGNPPPSEPENSKREAGEEVDYDVDEPQTGTPPKRPSVGSMATV